MTPAALAAQHLFDAHERRERFTPLPERIAPRTAAEAYGIQDAFVALRAQKLGAIGGYKIALTSAEMRRFVGVDTPQSGMMFEALIRRSPARIRAADYVRPIIEFEIGVEIGEDLPAADRPFSRERLSEAVGAVMAAMEIADDRDADYKQLAQHPLHLVADNSWNEGAVLGTPVKDWRPIDLGAVRGVATINGIKVGEGRGADCMGHPLDALAWLAEHLALIGRGLLRGDVVITGSIITSKKVKAGDRVRFEVEEFGGVELEID